MDKQNVKHWMVFALKLIPILLVIVWILTLVWIGVYKKQTVNITPQMMAYDFNGKADSAHYKVEHQWIPLDSISRNLVVAVLAAEDRNFFVHDGFALDNDSDSIVQPHDFLDKKTVSQRTANVVFLLDGKSRIHRIAETYYTVMIEEFWDKNRILEVYLNSALMGDGIFGAEAASQIYFRKKAGELTRDEASFIAAAMDNPRSVNVTNLSDSFLIRKKQILSEMGLLMNVRIGRKPVDEIEKNNSKPTYRRKWRG